MALAIHVHRWHFIDPVTPDGCPPVQTLGTGDSHALLVFHRPRDAATPRPRDGSPMLSFHLGLRYLRRRRAAWLACAAVVCTVAVPVVVMGVMQGWLEVTSRQTRANESDLTVAESWYGGSIADTPSLRAAVIGHPEVRAVAPFVSAYALLEAGANHQGPGRGVAIPCLLDAVEWEADRAAGRLAPATLHAPPVTDLSSPPVPAKQRGSGFLTPAWRDHLCLSGLGLVAGLGVLPPPPRLRPLPGVVAGRELLYGNPVNLGDQVRLTGATGRNQSFIISDTIGTGILETDRFLILMPLGLGQRLLDLDGRGSQPARVTGLRVATVSGTDLNRTASELRVATGESVLTWWQRRGQLVKSLTVQRNILGLVMILVQVVAVFIVYAVFSTLVAEKRHDIGVLLGLGVRRRQIAGAFLVAGAAACLGGGLVGWGLGWLVLWGLNPASRFFNIPLFPQDVIYTPEAPTSFDPLVPLFFIAVATVVGLLAVALPAWRATRIQPVDTLREGG